MTTEPGTDKPDQNAPLTVHELMEMRTRWKDHPGIIQAINRVLERRLAVPVERL